MRATHLFPDTEHKRGRGAVGWVVPLVLELAVVFIGVYAAFAFSQYEARKEAAARRQQLEKALVEEIQDLTSQTRRVAEALPRQLQQFDSARLAGARPALRPWIEPVRREPHMWQATLQSGALDLFDVPTVQGLSRFYNELDAGFDQIAQLGSLSESVLIPNLDRGSSEFYEADGRTLRSKYEWYREGLARLAQLAESITTQGDSLVAALSSRGAAESPE